MLFFLKQLKNYVYFTQISYIKNEIYLHVSLENILFFLKFFKLSEFFRFDLLVDLFAVDQLMLKEVRFSLVYSLLSITYNKRIIIKTYLNDLKSVVTVSSYFPCAQWWEREIWDLFGIFFKNHPDLRRILTDYGFVGYPLRKNFPVTGLFSIYYDLNQKFLIFNNSSLTQENRFTSYINPWICI